MTSRLRILLVRPPVDVVHKFSRPVEALGIAYLAAALRNDGHDVRIADAMLYDWSVEQTLSDIQQSKPDIIGFTIVLNHFPDRLIDLLARMAERGTPGIVLVGGHSVSFFAEEVLANVPRVDGVVIGEGEESFRQIAAGVQACADWRTIPGAVTRPGAQQNQHRPPNRITDLARLPWPARDTTEDVIRNYGVAAVSTSRGCYARCTFCSVPRFYGLDKGRLFASGSWIARPPDDVVSEIESLYSAFGIRELLIVDDEFFGGTEAGFERARSIGSMLAERKLGISFAISCRAENVDPQVLSILQCGGLAHVFIGVEAGTQAALKLYGKGHSVAQNKSAVAMVKSLGLSFQAGFMFFNPRITVDDLHENLAFLKDIGELKPMVINSTVDPHYGAPLVKLFRNDGILDQRALKMSVSYPDTRVRVAKAIAEMCASAFEPFMSFISVARSSVTYEWRRRVPGRTGDDELILDAYENAVNGSFASVFEHAVKQLCAGRQSQDVIAQAEEELRDVVERMSVAQALVIARLDATEDGIRYWSARCAWQRDTAGERV